MSPDKAPMSVGDAIVSKASEQAAQADDSVKGARTGASGGDDPAARFLAEVGPYPPMTSEQEKRLVRKIDRWLIPLLLFMGLFAAVDKVQLATGELYGFSRDTGLVGQQYSWLGSILSIGKKSEQPIRNGIIMTVFSSIVNDFLSWIVGLIPVDAPLARWQYLYLLTGSLNVLYSAFMLFYLPDSPMTARFLTLEEKWHAVQRLAENRTGIDGNNWKWHQALEAVMDIKIWIMFFFNIGVNIPNGGLITFGAIIIRNLGFDAQTSALLSMPNGVISSLSGFIASFCAAKWVGHRTFVVMIATCFPLLGTAIVYGLPRSNIGGQLFGLYMMYCYWAPYVTAISLPQANTAGSTKKVVTYGILLLGYGTGNLIGPQTFRAEQAPAYTGGTVAMLVCYCVSIFLMLVYFLVASGENRQRDRKYGSALEINEDNLDDLYYVFQDLTDKKQKDFRYVH